MSKSGNFSTTDTVTMAVSGGLDLGLENIAITQLPTIQLAVTQLPTIDFAVTQLPTIELAITQLPLIQLQFSMLPTRIHFPMNLHFNVCALGRELMSFGICGESMVVVEDYVPHVMERCS